MKTLSSGALRHLQLALPLLFFLGLLSSPAFLGAQPRVDDDSDVLKLPLRSETVQPSRTETMSLLAGICGPEHVQAEKDGTLRCDEAPAYPDEDKVQCGLDIRSGVLHGHFTSPQADEVVADYRGGCEPPIEGFGGLILLRKQDGIWRRITYFRSHRAARCLVFRRRDGRDALVCGNAYNLQGDRHASIELIELRSLFPGVALEDLLEAHSDEGTAYCERHAAGQRQLHSRLKGWERRPATKEAPEQLVVQVETEDFVTPGFCGKPSTNRNLDERSGEALNDKFAAFRAEQRRLETVTFDWDGERFRPSSPPSSPAIRLQEQSSDDDEGEGDDSDVLELTLRSEAVQPSRTETRNLLAGICGPEHVQAAKDGTLYCDKSPGYPDEDHARCGLDIKRGVLHGHFTSPRADEVVADYRGGCEPHAKDSGGSILLRKENGLWRRIAYFPGERAARCLVFRRRDGRDALVCGSAFSGQGDHSANIELRSLKPSVKPEDLLDVGRQEGSAFCEGFAAGERQLHTRFKDWERLPATKGMPERLVVQVETEDFVTPGFCGKSADNDKRADDDSYEELDDATAKALDDKFEALRAQHRRIETVTFDWNGERFVKKARHHRAKGEL
jgi:hypothetical protein